MRVITQFQHHRNLGFTLTEVMVAMVIGLLGIIVIMQVFSVFESQKRTTTGGDDAQNTGVIAMYGLEREIAQAGYGISSPKLIGCPLITPTISLPSLAPVIINPMKGTAAAAINVGNPLINAIPADANTDSLLIIYGSSNTVPEGSLITDLDNVGNTYTIGGGASLSGASAVGAGGRGFQSGDFVIADSGHRNLTTPTCPTLTLTQVNGNNTAMVPVNQMAGFTYDPVAAKTEFPTLYNFGTAPHIVAYAVLNEKLRVCDYAGSAPVNCATAPAAAWTELASGIVSMKAVCTSPAGIRLALITRNSQFDPTLTSPTLTWSGGTTITLPNTADGKSWTNFRYKIFETFIPIRNATWVGAKAC